MYKYLQAFAETPSYLSAQNRECKMMRAKLTLSSQMASFNVSQLELKRLIMMEKLAKHGEKFTLTVVLQSLGYGRSSLYEYRSPLLINTFISPIPLAILF